MKENNRNIFLALNITLQTALVVAVAMTIYAVFQYLSMPGHTVLGLALEHDWYVLVFGILTYGVMYYVLRKNILNPINDIYIKCYAITKGDYSRLEIEPTINEIQIIIDGINLLKSRITPEVNYHNRLFEAIKFLKTIISGGNFASEKDGRLIKLVASLNRLDYLGKHNGIKDKTISQKEVTLNNKLAG